MRILVCRGKKACVIYTSIIVFLSNFAQAETINVAAETPYEISENITGAKGADTPLGSPSQGWGGGTIGAGEDGSIGVNLKGISREESETIINSGVTVTGGSGGYGANGGDGGNGGNGASGINGIDMTISNTNSGIIQGGDGWIAGAGTSNGGSGNGGSGGTGGSGISGNSMIVINNGTLSGGNGGRAGYSWNNQVYRTPKGGDGGAGISGDNIIITNKSYGNIQGGNGGDGYYGFSHSGTPGVGGKGGIAISGSNLTITNENYGNIQGGNGKNGGSVVATANLNLGGKGGDGGSGISGSNLTVMNKGLILGGDGGIGGDGSRSGRQGDGGNGAVGIIGSNLVITNNGTISGGAGGSGGVNGNVGAAINFTGDSNSLTLKSNSEIIGDIILSRINPNSINSLAIISDAATIVTGNLTAYAYSDLTLSGDTLTLTKAATFAANTSLTFDSMHNGIKLSADSASFSGTKIKGNSAITDWTQYSYTLITTTNGITNKLYTDSTTNEFLTDGSKDYAGLYISSDSKNLLYGLKWNDVSGNGYGTFDLKEGSTVSLSVVLADNNSSNSNDWDGISLTKSGKGTLILTKNNTYTGTTNISDGTLKTGIKDAFSSTSGVIISSDATLNLGGNSQTVNTLDNSGILLINDYGVAVLSNDVVLLGNITNSGLVIINNGSYNAGQTLKVDGDWVGTGGTVSIGTVLGNDSSLTDKLVITGSATGTTYVSVTNENGSGAQTLEGIEVITTGSSTSNAFIQNGRIIAGSYEYHLQQGTASGNNLSNWYLTSKNKNGTDDDTDIVPTLRPEAGSYIANLASANTLFNTTLHDRLGETQYTDLLTGEKLVTSMWIRSQVGQNKFEAGHGQLKNKSNWTLVQLGGDIVQWSSNDDNRLHLGVMAGYGRSRSDTDSHLSGYSAKGSIDGYSVGLYGTWYDNYADKTGFYVDSWVLWNHFNAKVHGQELAREKYKLKGITASIESGYTFKLGESQFYNYWLQPKAQITYMGVDADSHTESNGTKVKGDANNWQSRLGLRLSANTNNLFNSKHTSAGQLFIEANWLHNSEPFSVKMNNSRISQDGARNIAEIKTGVEANILANTNVWFNLNYQRGDHNYRNLGAMLGAKYSF